MEGPILLVDDEEGILRVLEIVLRDKGYEVVKARKGEEALRLCEEFCPPVIFIDLEMPGIGGVATFKELKSRWSNRKVVLLTGHLDEDLSWAGSEENICDILKKPISYQDIHDVLEKLASC